MPRRPDHRSEAAKAYRWLYDTKAWKTRRKAQLADFPLCSMCEAEDRLTSATVADHVIEHKGDEDLFFAGELQSLCKPHHDGAKQAEERRGYGGAYDLDGYPLDPRHPGNR